MELSIRCGLDPVAEVASVARTVLDSELTSAANEPLGPKNCYTSKRLAASTRNTPTVAERSISLVKGRLNTGGSHLRIKYCTTFD